MSDTIEVRIPNIGDFHDLPIIAILVKEGDTIALESPLVELESEKATMEVPSPAAGVVQRVTVTVGDKVSEGSTILTLSSESATPVKAAPAPAPVSTNGAGVAPAVAATHASSASAVVEFRVPDIGDFENIPVIEVLVAAGDRVEKETSLVTLESEKATMDVPAVEAGVVRDVKLKVGDRVSKGALIALVEVASAAAPAQAPTPQPATPAPVSAPVPAAVVPSSYGAPGDAGEAGAPNNGVVHASPSIRRFARELGVDLHAVAGSGPHERVTRDDVQNYVKAALARPAPASAGGALPFDLPPWPKPDFAQYGEIERVPLSRIRKFSGPNLHRNWVTIPHVTNNDEADVTDLEAFRKKCNAENPTAKVTMLAFVVKACVAALAAFPDVNSSLDGDELIHKRYYNIGFAADTPNGLVVPVLKNADRKGILEIANESAALAKKARDGKLGMGDMSGATFTISSLGGIGGTSFTPIVNAPEVAILGLSRAALKPVWDGTAFVPRLMLPLSLSYDHRVIDGALAARFNAALAASLGDLRRVLL